MGRAKEGIVPGRDERIGIVRERGCIDDLLGPDHTIRRVRVGLPLAASIEHDVVCHAVSVDQGRTPHELSIHPERGRVGQRGVDRRERASGSPPVRECSVGAIRVGRELVMRVALLAHAMAGVYELPDFTVRLLHPHEIAEAIDDERGHAAAWIGDALDLSSSVIREDHVAADGVCHVVDLTRLRARVRYSHHWLAGALAPLHETSCRVESLDDCRGRIKKFKTSARKARECARGFELAREAVDVEANEGEEVAAHQD